MEEILIVDDAMFMRRIIKNALTEGGFDQFIEAKDGDEAIRLFKKHRPKLVLLDITMPGKSGIEVLAELLKMEPGTRVVMCSAIGQDATIEKAIRMGAHDFIVKPFKNEQLVEMVKKSM